MLLTARDGAQAELVERLTTGKDGVFSGRLPSFTALPPGTPVEITYPGGLGYAPCATRVTVNQKPRIWTMKPSTDGNAYPF
ncbi:hypothetical protein Aph01nite_60120 [Acrocarpospora phusangensis]|uniref:Uncharacterized protein n=1 Tax=Acrocarpospora phusangensis TaxID=1070424 RepID=A0A919QK82_9ACTN|nr:hypothetical protein [Acrocarpospora phusangensis]GIH27702.1 hypothetical protein Aph01nite_60120 [Acrocarpospora phusangensis]